MFFFFFFKYKSLILDCTILQFTNSTVIVSFATRTCEEVSFVQTSERECALYFLLRIENLLEAISQLREKYDTIVPSFKRLISKYKDSTNEAVTSGQSAVPRLTMNATLTVAPGVAHSL